MTNSPSPWWHPDRHQDRRAFLMARNRIKAALRAWFNDQGFVEVETACLQMSPGNEAHLHAFKTERIGTDLSTQPLYLHTSPEFACKKLLAAGEENIFTFAPVFRNREAGPLHASEFTMLEWYRAHGNYESLWRDCAEILNVAARASNLKTWTYRGRASDAAKPCEHLSVDQAFSHFANIDLAATYYETRTDRDALAKCARPQGLTFSADDSWADLFSRILTEHVEPYLGVAAPLILHSYPAALSALARPLAASPKHAERFELYVCGIELANGFGEQTDPVKQRSALEAEMDLKQQRYGERYPIDEDFLAALERMPHAAGCALGFDRLVMLATGATHIDQVQWTPGKW